MEEQKTVWVRWNRRGVFSRGAIGFPRTNHTPRAVLPCPHRPTLSSSSRLDEVLLLLWGEAAHLPGRPETIARGSELRTYVARGCRPYFEHTRQENWRTWSRGGPLLAGFTPADFQSCVHLSERRSDRMRPRLHTNAIMLQFYSCMQIRDTHQIGRALCVGCEKVGVRTDSEWYELGEHRGLGRITTVCRAGGAEIAAHGRAQIIQGVQQAVGLVVRDWEPRLSQAYGSGLEETPHREAVHLEAVCASFLGG